MPADDNVGPEEATWSKLKDDAWYGEGLSGLHFNVNGVGVKVHNDAAFILRKLRSVIKVHGEEDDVANVERTPSGDPPSLSSIRSRRSFSSTGQASSKGRTSPSEISIL